MRARLTLPGAVDFARRLARWVGRKIFHVPIHPRPAADQLVEYKDSTMITLPSRFLELPQSLAVCNSVSTRDEIDTANAIRKEYLLPGEVNVPFMEDVARAFRLADKAKVYIEVGTQDKGNIAWLARTKLSKGATIIDIDFLEYPENDKKIKDELSADFDYHALRGDCLSEEILSKVKEILNGRSADLIFCDSHYTFSHTLTEFALYYPLVRQGGHLLFHDAQWPGDPNGEGEGSLKGKGLAVEQIDRFYPTWMVVGPNTPLYRAMPIASRTGHWGTLAVIPA